MPLDKQQAEIPTPIVNGLLYVGRLRQNDGFYTEGAEWVRAEDARRIERALAEAKMDFEGRKASEEFAVRELNRLLETKSAPRSAIAEPIEMLLFCPRCGMQHVDAPNAVQGWTNPPHATHTCQGCGLLWRPSNENTTGALHIAVKEEKHRERILASWPRSHVEPSTKSSSPEIPDNSWKCPKNLQTVTAACDGCSCLNGRASALRTPIGGSDADLVAWLTDTYNVTLHDNEDAPGMARIARELRAARSNQLPSAAQQGSVSIAGTPVVASEAPAVSAPSNETRTQECAQSEPEAQALGADAGSTTSVGSGSTAWSGSNCGVDSRVTQAGGRVEAPATSLTPSSVASQVPKLATVLREEADQMDDSMARVRSLLRMAADTISRTPSATLSRAVSVKAAFTLGGAGSSVCRTEAELSAAIKTALAASPTRQIQIEEIEATESGAKP